MKQDLSIGLAMIARNAEESLQKVIEPFLMSGGVDDICIVLGGISSDKTEEVARNITGNVHMCGATFENGGLRDFSVARNLSLDNLNTDWVIVVDTDDSWYGIDLLRQVVTLADKGGANHIYVPYHLNGAQFIQARIFKKGSGRFVGPIHEVWTPNSIEFGMAAKNKEIVVSQRGDITNDRLLRNILIAEENLSNKSVDRLRLLSHLVQDYSLLHEYDTAFRYSQTYMVEYEHLGDKVARTDEKVSTLIRRAMIAMQMGKYEVATEAAIQAIGLRDYGVCWSVLAECFNLQGGNMYRLAIHCADEALKRGVSDVPFPVSSQNVTSAPYHIKAIAYRHLGDKEAALSSARLALLLNPDSTPIKELVRELQ